MSNPFSIPSANTAELVVPINVGSPPRTSLAPEAIPAHFVVPLVFRNDLPESLVGILDLVGYPDQGATILIKEDYDDIQLHDTNTPLEVRQLLTQQGTWLGFHRTGGLLEKSEFYLSGLLQTPGELLAALRPRLAFDGIKYKLHPNHLDLYRQDGDEVHHVHIHNPQLVEEKIVWAVTQPRRQLVPSEVQEL